MNSTEQSIRDAEQFQRHFSSLKEEIQKVIVGQDEIIDLLLISLFSKGHCLLVGVPGLAKTLLIKTLSDALNLDFSRIQFTPDLMPGDVTGTEVVEENKELGTKQFRFIKGPIFANILLADEINRTPPKTQSALLEGMQEYQITASGKTYTLDPPFFVLATQNPIEQEGTYPLPEAQLDRFMFQLWVDYPSIDQEKSIVQHTTKVSKHTPTIQINKDDLLKYQDLILDVPIPSSVLDYTIQLVASTRPQKNPKDSISNKYLSWGAGPRASQYLILGAKTKALSEGRFSITEEDIKSLAIPVLRHRIIPNYAAEAEGLGSVDIITKLLAVN
ncbi:MAG: MoxR family ATPase [Bacteroidetes bacterium]|nr:MoxR family ATPase [Bacteroidota bacterium]